ncbi:hypothetical protein POL68_37475 [Stigmatella sp. ncwal1]|uniref:Uncharacterized protein n=1 Tax=Stigmatella ashevillensis TaxID=2995309 RepID=A0ABT5DN93_9BACT|nr:hypothetical protein [Stigmatella ashevillena]MDC0714213.1 hypothetical protein [Stigmatella ashevillena]
MRHTLVPVALLLLALSACATNTTENDTLVEEIEPSIVVRTTRDADGNALSILVEETRARVLANGRYTVAIRRWEANVADPEVQEFREDLMTPPTLPEMNERLVTAWRRVLAESAATDVAYDSPGCDLVPDSTESHCIQNCCAAHDQCYDQNDCSFTSWLPGAGSSECNACNTSVRQCVGACAFEPPPCENSACGCNQSQCYDDDCEAGTNLYCANNCNNPGAGPCRNPNPYPSEACATRLSLHGGAVVACVPWCENLGLGKASGWWFNETLWCCVCEREPNAPEPRETWPWLTKPWPYPIPDIHWRDDGHWQPSSGPCTWYAPSGYWLCG